MEKAITIVLILLGLLKFAQEAPKLFKDMFMSGDMFKGLDFKPGIKKRIQENDLAMRGINGISSGIGGAIGRNRTARETGKGVFRKTIGGALSGTIGGLKSTNRKLGVRAMMNEVAEGAQRAEDASANFESFKRRTARTFTPDGENSFINRVDTNFFGGARQQANFRINSINEDDVSSIDVKGAKELKTISDRVLSKIFDDSEIKNIKDRYNNGLAKIQSELALTMVQGANEDDDAYQKRFNDAVKQKSGLLKASRDSQLQQRMSKIFEGEEIKQMAAIQKNAVDQQIKQYGKDYGNTVSDLYNSMADLFSTISTGTQADIQNLKYENINDLKTKLSNFNKIQNDKETVSKENLKRQQQNVAAPEDAKKEDKK